MDLPNEPVDETTRTGPARRPSLFEELEALRPPLDDGPPPEPVGPTEPERASEPERPEEPELAGPKKPVDLPMLVSRLLTVTSAVLLVWGFVLWRQTAQLSDPRIRSVVAGETAVRAQVGETSTPAALPPVAVSESPTTTTTVPADTAPPADPAPAVTPDPSTTTTAPPRPATTTSTTTTTRPPAPPRPISATSASAVFPGVQLTLEAAPPASGAIRTAQFSVEAEFGDARVLRSARFELGDGTVVDGSVRSWACGDPAAPNPYVLSGPTSTYAAPGTYTVTVTVRTAPCAIDGGTEEPEETAQVRLVLTVP